MKRIYLSLIVVFAVQNVYCQDVTARISKAVALLENDPAMRHAIFSFCVEDATGKTIFKRNAEMGVAAASSQKVLTSVAAFEILGNDFRFVTRLATNGVVKDGLLQGDLLVQGSGDPSLGSWRYKDTKPQMVLKSMTEAIKSAGIRQVAGQVRFDSSNFSSQRIPDGWIWQDIGNYYGAGAGKLNWKENQYDLQLRSGGALDGPVQIINGRDSLENKELYYSELKSAARGTGDNAIIYLPVGTAKSLVNGTIPVNESRFVISGAMTDPEKIFAYDLEQSLKASGITVSHQPMTEGKSAVNEISAYTSPSLDSLNFWFLRRSINLYGEALIKSIAFSRTGYAGTNAGVEAVRNFWSTNGIEKSAIKIMDGSGLSPQNRVTTQALVTTMRFAVARPWFASFYEALPTINGLKMKSGSIGGARSFTGYIGKQNKISYVFAIVANNYDNSSAAIVQKLYAILDVLK